MGQISNVKISLISLDLWVGLMQLISSYAMRLKRELLKWATNDLCEPIKKLFNLVAKEGFTTTWTINIIQMIFEYGERHTLRNYRTIMLETIFH